MKAIFLGFGKHARIYADVLISNGFTINGICVRKTRNYSGFQKKYSIKKIYNNYKNILSNEEYDLVFVFLPWNVIDKKIIDIIKLSKKDVYCEKPIALSLNKLNKIITCKRKLKKNLYVLYNRRFYFITKKILNILKKNKFEKFQLFISEKEKEVEKKMSKKIIGKIKYHLTSHWIDWFMFLSKQKKFKFYKKGNNQIFEKKYKDKILIIKINNKKKNPLKVLMKFKKFSIKCITLEKLFITKNKKEVMYVDEKTKNAAKPGIINIVKEIKKNIKNKSRKTIIPQPEELIDLYENLENLNF